MRAERDPLNTFLRHGDASPAGELVWTERAADTLQSCQVYVVAAILAFGVLAFGAVENWSVLVLAIGSAALLLVWCAEQLLRRNAAIRLQPLFFPAAAFGCVIAAQYAFQWTSYAYATKTSLIVGATIAILFFVASQALATRRHLARFAATMSIFGFAAAVLAIAQRFTSPNKIYWSVIPRDGGLVFGPYVNRNHWAGCMELLAPLALVWALDHTMPRSKRLALAFMGIVMAASIFVAQSRGGMAAFVLQLVFFAIVTVVARRRTAALGLVAAFFTLTLALSLWLSSGTMFDRFEQSGGMRLTIARDTLRMVAQRPVLGWGAGTYESIYPAFRSFSSVYAIDHAHNDYLELLAETGIVGLAIAITFTLVLYRTAWKSFVAGQRSTPGLRIAALIGCTGLLVHSWTDFNMHIPANAALFMVLAAIAGSGFSTKYNAGPRHQVDWQREY